MIQKQQHEKVGNQSIYVLGVLQSIYVLESQGSKVFVRARKEGCVGEVLLQIFFPELFNGCVVVRETLGLEYKSVRVFVRCVCRCICACVYMRAWVQVGVCLYEGGESAHLFYVYLCESRHEICLWTEVHGFISYASYKHTHLSYGLHMRDVFTGVPKFASKFSRDETESPALKRSNRKTDRSGDPNILSMISSVSGVDA